MSDLKIVIDHLTCDYKKFENKGNFKNDKYQGDQNFIEFMLLVSDIKDLHIEIFSNIIHCLSSL